MSTENPKQQPKLSTDSLLETSKKGDIELTEQELGKVTGGTFKFTSTIKDKVETYLANELEPSGLKIPPS
jgi:hypothetical protein